MITTRTLRAVLIATGALTIGGLLQAASAQTYIPVYQPVPVYRSYAPVYVAPPVAVAPVAPRFSDEQLDQLLAPIALYPDPLLAQVLPASTYPQDIVAAQRWLTAYPQPTEDAINAQSWDPSIKALVHYPSVLQMMNDKLDWTQALGAAFVNQQQDVTESIQRLRVQAQTVGALATTAQQQVIVASGAISILPADPQVIYVPQYDPELVYVVQPVYVGERRPWITFGVGLRVGGWLDNDFDWDHHWVAVGADWRHDRDRHEDDPRGWNQHDLPPRAGGDFRGRNDAPAARTVAPPVTRAWSHNQAKPAPVAPPTYNVRPTGNDHRGYASPAVAPHPGAPAHAPEPAAAHPANIAPPVRPEPAPRPVAPVHAPEPAPARPANVAPPAPTPHPVAPPPAAVRPEPTPRPVAPAASPAPVHPAAVAPPATPRPASSNAFGGYENRVDVQRSVSRGQQSQPPAAAPAAPAHVQPSPAPMPVPAATPQAPHAVAQPPLGPQGSGADASAESARGHQSMKH
jgi:hypothetical protein